MRLRLLPRSFSLSLPPHVVFLCSWFCLLYEASAFLSGSINTRWTFQRSSSSSANSDGIGVGIDLGTTYSAVAAILKEEGIPQIISVPGNGRTMPSVLCFEDKDKFLVGQAACDREVELGAYRNVKRVLGTGGKLPKDIIDVVPHTQVNPNGKTYKKNNLPNQLHDAQENPTLLKATYEKGELIRPEIISSHIIKALKQAAEAHTGQCVNRAVIGVPAYFNDQQREATTRAAEMAGIPKVKLLREPEAAALAYGIGKEQLLGSSKARKGNNDNNDELVLVFDLGGGTYDVSMLLVGGGVTEIISTSGNAQLGGSNFDHRVAQHCVGVLKKHSSSATQKQQQQQQQQQLLTWQSEEVMNAIVRAAERIRIYLSNNKFANLAFPLDPVEWSQMGDSESVILPNNYQQPDADNEQELSLSEEGRSNSTHVLCRLSRRTMERLCRDEFQALLRPIREVAIFSGALLPGDSSPTAVEAALLGMEEEETRDALSFDDFYKDDDNDDDDEDDYRIRRTSAAVSNDDDDDDDDGQADSDVLLLELRQMENELEIDDMRQAKRAQQRGRKRARNVAKEERKYRAEKRKLLVPVVDNGGGGGATKVRDGITGRPISRVVLVGGATRMPAIGRLLAALTGVVPQKTVNPDEAVALGCAVHVGVLDGQESMGTVLNPMQAAILRAFAEKQGRLQGDDDDDDDADFETIEYS